ncbi:MAG TPA: hypothetical protein PLD49_08330 [Thermoclostridium caenicola]|uniref:hypothetical protein n=1 Tax=Thermoclostridium caenicola TaxID=659425 RepID=UPI002CE3BCB3|nr:hypothetical protein [Thermoclostridium caenicola]HOK43657.1 hypothetical protein [Thermoclostridium caenicola]HOL85434.1 hypothetical protein [Thermoclostridium caenicola]HPO77027.1 hypothetical protein [Thermoclostridium caenicola]
MDNQPRKVRLINAYFKESIKFYDLDRPVVARVIFVLLLGVLFGGYLLARPFVFDLYTQYEQLFIRLQENMSLDSLNSVLFASGAYETIARSFMYVALIFLGIRVLTFFISLFYGSWYFFGLTNPQMSGAQRTSVFFARLPKIILFNLLFYAAIYVVVAVMVVATVYVPGLAVFTALLPMVILIVSTLYVFKDLLIIEFDVGPVRNFRKSLELTRNSRKYVISNMMSLYALGWLLNLFSMDVENAALALFISAFLESMLKLITQRLSVLMFIDAASLERKDRVSNQDETLV